MGLGGKSLQLHIFGDSLTLVVHARDTLLHGTPSAAARLRSWMVRHSVPTAPGSFGAMLVDSRCEALALHVVENGSDGRMKWVALLSVVHKRLWEACPWHMIPMGSVFLGASTCPPHARHLWAVRMHGDA